MDKNSLPDALKRTVMEFFEDISENIPMERADREDLVLVKFFFQRLLATNVMSHAITKLVPLKKEIQDRKKDFFIEQRNILFQGLPQDRVDRFANIVTSSALADDDLEPLWHYMDTMIALAESYKKLC